jgi:hypothetical protein
MTLVLTFQPTAAKYAPTLADYYFGVVSSRKILWTARPDLA